MIKPGNKSYDYILIIIIGVIFFIPSLGKVHLFDWDEINFAESAREMLLTNDFFRVQVNFKPFWEKPPLFIWFQAFSMKIFGVNEFAARLPNAITGIITLCTIFYIGSKNFSRAFGWFWVLAYTGSFLTHLYFKSGIIDPLFNLFIFLGIYNLAITSDIEKNTKGRYFNIFFAGLFIGLGVLTKGPVALLVALLCILIFSFIKKELYTFSFKEYVIFFFCILCISFCWFGVETLKNGPWFLQEFITYQIRLFKTQDAGHGGPFIYHFIVLYFGCFPSSVFIFQGFKKYLTDKPVQKILKLWFIISFFVVLILFSIVKTKIVHYSSFCYFPLTFLCAYVLEKIYKKEINYRSLTTIQILIIGFLISTILIALPLVLKNKEKLLPSYSYLIKDPFALANLQAKVFWSGYEFLIGAFYLLSILLIIFLKRSFVAKAIALFIVTSLVITATLNIIVPKIERYSQGAAIDFFKSLKDKDVYVEVHGYKSYAQLFYTFKKPLRDTLSINKEWLLYGSVDKDVYMICKIDNTELDNNKGFNRIGNENGYVYYLRKSLTSKQQQ